MSCVAPLGVAMLVEYALGELTREVEEQLEEHLFACDACAADAGLVVALGEGVARATRAGGVRVVLTPSLLARLEGEGARVRSFEARPGEVVPCAFAASDEYLLNRLHFPPTEAARLDLRVYTTAGVEVDRMPDLPIDARRGELVFVERVTHAGDYPTQFLLRVVAVRADGEEVLGEYRYEHQGMLA